MLSRLFGFLRPTPCTSCAEHTASLRAIRFQLTSAAQGQSGLTRQINAFTRDHPALAARYFTKAGSAERRAEQPA